MKPSEGNQANDRPPSRSARQWADIYLTVAAPIVMLMSLLMKPFGVPDESNHFLKAVSVAQGRILPLIADQPFDGRLVPMAGDRIDTGAIAFYDALVPTEVSRRYTLGDINSLSNIRPTNEYRFEPFVNTAIYPPLLYLPQAMGILAARALGLPVLAWFYLARFMNAVIWITSSYLAIRVNRSTARVLFLLALIPMVLQQVASVSADALLFGLSIMFAALIARLADDRRTLRGLPLHALGLATIGFGAGKVGYILLALLPPMIAWWNERKCSGKVVFLTLCAVAAISIWMGWAWMIHGNVYLYRSGERIDPGLQMAYTVAHPITVVTLMSREIVSGLPAVTLQMVGRKLGWMTITLPLFACLATWALIVLNVAVGAKGMVGRRRFLPLAAAVSLVSIVTIYFLLFLQYNRIGATTIIGFQGRYLIPMAMACAVLAPAIPCPRRWIVTLGRVDVVWMTALSVLTSIIVGQASWIV